MVLYLRARMEHVRYRRRVPSLPPPVDFNPVPFVRSLVAAFGLVCYFLMQPRNRFASPNTGAAACPRTPSEVPNNVFLSILCGPARRPHSLDL